MQMEHPPEVLKDKHMSEPLWKRNERVMQQWQREARLNFVIRSFIVAVFLGIAFMIGVLYF